MTDDTIETSDKPIPFPDRQIDPPDHEPVEEAPQSAAVRLRTFEDEHLGKDAVRLHGHVEKGFGSKFKNLPEAKHRQYAALEKLVHTEAHLADSHAKLLQAEADHEAALAAADAAESEPDGDE